MSKTARPAETLLGGKVSEILFYHLTESRLEQTLPGLVERSLARGWRAAVICKTLACCQELDRLLWVFADSSFIPHGMAAEPYPREQPVLLSAQDSGAQAENLNGADVCFCAEGAITPNPQLYQRVCLLFDGGNEAELNAARALWKMLKAEEKDGAPAHQLTYWQQSPTRKWEKKA